MRYFLRQQSTGEILRTTFDIYRRHFFVLVLIYMAPILPFQLWDIFLRQTTGRTFNVATYVVLAVANLPFMAITVAISEIALGNRPSVARAYSRVFDRRFVPILVTYLLLQGGFLLTFLLLVVPGLFFWAWFMFTLPVVMVEGRTGWAAFKRSRLLGRGHYLRNSAIVWSAVLVYFVLCAVFIIAYITLGIALPALAQPWPLDLAFVLVGNILAPLMLIPPILLYFDMRARKEAYDTALLTEDLLR